jgi:hypothetical protein
MKMSGDIREECPKGLHDCLGIFLADLLSCQRAEKFSNALWFLPRGPTIPNRHCSGVSENLWTLFALCLSINGALSRSPIPFRHYSVGS